MKKRIISFVLILTMLCALITVFASAESTTATTSILFQLDNKSAWINGIKTGLIEEPQLLNGRTMVPFRVLAESIGCSVEWVAETREIIVTKNSDTNYKILYKLDDAAIYKLGKSGYDFFYRMDTTPVLSANGNTLLPARYVADFFGFETDWADSYNSVIIYPQAASAEMALGFDERKQKIKDIILPVANSATVDSFKIDEERFISNIVNEINRLLSLEGKRELSINTDLVKIANFRVYESYKYNYWEIDSYTYGNDWEKLYRKVIGKYHAPNYEIHGFTSTNAATIAQNLKIDPDIWDELKDSEYSNIGIGLVKVSGEYTPIIIIAAN